MTVRRMKEADKRRVACPTCGALRGRPCKGLRTPAPSTLGGGWGGPPERDTAHDERRTAALAAQDMGAIPGGPAPERLMSRFDLPRSAAI